MSFENSAIAGRRVYLLDPTTGQHWRLNDTDAFQDAPTWSDDGSILYYVQRQGDTMALMAADLATGQAQVIEGSRRPAPGAVGYYGQSDWDDLLAHRPEAPSSLSEK
jgi:Tol biopolymer transport system component